MSSTGLKLAVKLTGAHLVTGLEKTFYFSNSGFVADIDGDGEQIYYEPLIKGSILSKILANSTDDAVSIVLINKDLNILSDYVFNGYDLEVFVTSTYAPEANVWYAMYKGACDTLLIKWAVVEIKAVSSFDVFNKSMNPETFTGVKADYEGEVDLLGTTKPRLFGMVFNISPILLRADNLVYGCNWAYDGTRETITEFSSVRDGGVELEHVADYATTATMDLQTPAAGKYVTCVAEGTFKLGSKPVYSITCDVEQETLIYTDIVQMLSTELSLNGSIVYYESNFTLGLYLTNNTDYISFNKQVTDNLDLVTWFDGNKRFNVNTLRQNYSGPTIARFIDAGKDFRDDQDILVFSMDRTGYSLPPKQNQVGYKHNYTVQQQEQLAGAVSQNDRELYKAENLFSSRKSTCDSDIYINQISNEYLTAIYWELDAFIEAWMWIEQREAILDEVKIVCPILAVTDSIILGVIVNPDDGYITFASTHISISSDTVLMSNNNTGLTGLRSLRLSDVVSLDSLYFDYTDVVFVVNGIEINTNTMQVTYNLVGKREISKCN